MKKLILFVILSAAQSAFATLALNIAELGTWNSLPPSGKGLFHIYAVREALLPDQTSVYVATYDSGTKSNIPDIVPSRAVLLSKEEVETVNSFLKEAYAPAEDGYRIVHKKLCGSTAPLGQVFQIKGAINNKAGLDAGCTGGVSVNTKKVIELLEQAVADKTRETLEAAQKRAAPAG